MNGGFLCVSLGLNPMYMYMYMCVHPREILGSFLWRGTCTCRCVNFDAILHVQCRPLVYHLVHLWKVLLYM